MYASGSSGAADRPWPQSSTTTGVATTRRAVRFGAHAARQLNGPRTNRTGGPSPECTSAWRCWGPRLMSAPCPRAGSAADGEGGRRLARQDVVHASPHEGFGLLRVGEDVEAVVDHRVVDVVGHGLRGDHLPEGAEGPRIGTVLHERLEALGALASEVVGTVALRFEDVGLDHARAQDRHPDRGTDDLELALEGLAERHHAVLGHVVG